MKQAILFFVLSITALIAQAAEPRAGDQLYDPSPEYPYGRPNPDAPPQLSQFHFMVGRNDCTDEVFNPNTEQWLEGQRTWDAHYYLNGYGIIDSGRSGSAHNGNIRIFDPLTQQWRVTYFSMPVYGSGEWTGGVVGEEIVLRQPQKAPGTDIDGFSTLTFSNISAQGFDWRGEWISSDGSFVHTNWRISCKKLSS